MQRKCIKKKTYLSFVLGVAVYVAKLVSTVCKLAFNAITAATKLFPRTTQLSLQYLRTKYY